VRDVEGVGGERREREELGGNEQERERERGRVKQLVDCEFDGSTKE